MALQIQRRAFDAAYTEFQNQANLLYDRIFGFHAAITSRTIDVGELYALIDTINTVVARLQLLFAITGFRNYVLAQSNNTTDLNVDLPAARTAVHALRDAAFALVPQSAGFELAYTRQADGSRVPRQFTTATTNPLVVLCTNAMTAMV